MVAAVEEERGQEREEIKQNCGGGGITQHNLAAENQ